MCDYKISVGTNTLNEDTITNAEGNVFDDRLFICNMCHYKTTARTTYESHINTHTGHRPFACNICNYKAVQSGTLNRHMRTHTGERPYECPVCYFQFAHKSSMMRHLQMHTSELLYECNMCNFKFVQIIDLRRHFKKSHTKIKEFKYSCQFCGFKCFVKKTLNLHMTSHTGGKPFKCEWCDETFLNSDGLKRHSKKHIKHTQSLHPCRLCGTIIFLCASDLRRHIKLRHTKEERFTCIKCDYKCNAENDLKQHVMSHFETKPSAFNILSDHETVNSNTVKLEDGGKSHDCNDIKSESYTGEIILGFGQQQDSLRDTGLTKKIHVAFFEPDTTSEEIMNHMQKLSKGLYHVEKQILAHNFYASFILTVPESKYQLFINSDAWPAGTELCEWVERDTRYSLVHNYQEKETLVRSNPRLMPLLRKM